MIIVNMLGGLGNQMFQYAFGYAVSQKNSEILKLDITSFETYDLRNYELDLYSIDAILASQKEITQLKYKDEDFFEKMLRKIKREDMVLSNCYYKESDYFRFDKNVFNVDSDVYFDGYWQNEKYFIKYRDELLEKFTLREETHPISQQYKKKIKDAECSVSIHIRRGDYVTNAHTNSVHGTCDLSYYENTVHKMEEKYNSPHFFIFSDDLDWAKENLDFISQITFIELGEDVPDHEEMYLMSQCQHNIIANSSFSWWGAWLNRNLEKTVFAPKQWFKVGTYDTSDLIPSDWIVL